MTERRTSAGWGGAREPWSGPASHRRPPAVTLAMFVLVALLVVGLSFAYAVAHL